MKEKIVVITFVITLFTLMILSFLLPDKEVSFSERRSLATLPKVDIEEIFGSSGTFFEDLNDYFVDQFPFRDSFRKIKGVTLSKVGKKENHGVFIKDNVLFQMNETINEKSVNHLITKIKYVDDMYLGNQNIYFGFIPDKNYYLNNNSIPKLNYQKLQKMLKESLPNNYKFIDLTDTLTLDSYYRTDIHWRQEELEPVVSKLQKEMSLDNYSFPDSKNSYEPFYGALYGSIASNIKPDSLNYFTNSTIDDAVVYNYEKKTNQNVYTKNYLKNVDSYDVFLSGATSLLFIENKKQTNGRELILFRDSFGSSLAPLLISNYSKITIIDLRYLSSTLLGNIPEINFEGTNQDVLFLYSVPIINNSFTLK